MSLGPEGTPRRPPTGGDEPFRLAARAAAVLRDRLGGPPEVAIVLGSGWAAAEARLGRARARLATSDLPGYPRPSAPGHAGRISAVEVAGRRVAVISGRVHLYEGHPPAVVVHGVRSLVLAGARTVVLTNAAGALRPEVPVGGPVLLRDHLNLTGRSPLVGPLPPAPHRGRFIDVGQLYDPGLRRLVRCLDPTVPEAVYAGVLGPQFETPAEVSMLARLGADVVGMSTVLEAIAAHHLGARILALSLVTNPASGLAPGPVDGEEVLRVGRGAARPLGALLARVVAQLDEAPA